MNEVETKIITELQALSMLTQKYSIDSEIASYVFETISEMLIKIRGIKDDGR